MLPRVTVTERVPALVATAAAALADEQWRVAGLLATAAARDAWQVPLGPDGRRRLVRLGHFSRYSAELDWTAHEVAGHLRDSASIFTQRLRLMCARHEPLLPDFATSAPRRLAGYRAISPPDLVAQVRRTQAGLLQAVVAVGADQLGRTGRHAVDGELTVADVLEFLPGHQRDHADQLSALLG
jgi:hypothetical protein